MKIPLYTQEGSQKGEVDVSDKIFGVKTNKALIHRVMLMQLANKRHPIAHTLTKGEVRGGGKKPYRQKHTGRARQGSNRSPHFKGGGVAFGPRNERNFQTKIPKRERRLALFTALSEKAKSQNISALEGYSVETPKTKLFANFISKLPFQKKILFVLPGKDTAIVRSSKNISRVKTVQVNYLNIVDILNHQDVIFLKDSLKKLEETFK